MSSMTFLLSISVLLSLFLLLVACLCYVASRSNHDTLRDLCDLRLRASPDKSAEKMDTGEPGEPAPADEAWWSRASCAGKGFMPSCIGPAQQGVVVMPSQRQCLGDRLYARCRHLHPVSKAGVGK